MQMTGVYKEYLRLRLYIFKINKKSEPITYWCDVVRIILSWYAWRDSNARPTESESVTLSS